MNEITLAGNGAIIHKGKVVEKDPLLYLGARVELEENFTLRSYFEILVRYPILVGLNVFFGSYMDQYRKSPPSGSTFDELTCLEFNKTVEMIGFPGKPRLEIYTSLCGMRGGCRIDIRPISIENLLDSPVRLGALKHIIFGDRADIFEFQSVVTLFELLDGIAWDLSFHSTPTNVL